MELTERQERIVDIVKTSSPITGEQIAAKLELNRSTLRSDLAVLTMAGVLEARPRVGYIYRGGHKASTVIADKLRQLRVGDFKSVPAVVGKDCSIYEAIVAMFTQNVGSLIVVGDDKELIGMVSRKDLLKASLGGADLKSVPVSVIMTRMPNIIMVTSDETVLDAAKKIVQHEVDTLPVVETFIDENGNERYEVIGRFTKTNIAKLFVEIANMEL